MNKRDLFYFSKADRRASVILILLIAAINTVSVRVGRTLRSKRQEINAEVLADTLLPLSAKNSKPRQRTYYRDTVYVYRTVERSAPPYSGKSFTKAGVNSHLADTLANPYAPLYKRQEKLSPGERLDINKADTTMLKMVPTVGGWRARQIVSYRERLGGFVSLSQLLEIEGLEDTIANWFFIDSLFVPRKLPLSSSLSKLREHPYVNFYQAKVITEYRKRYGSITNPAQLSMFEEFAERDLERLLPYLEFE